jgi:hypothetical protein
VLITYALVPPFSRKVTLLLIPKVAMRGATKLNDGLDKQSGREGSNYNDLPGDWRARHSMINKVVVLDQ